MSNLFWLATVVMASAAMLLVARPLVSRQAKSWRPGILVVFLVPLLAIALYNVLGKPEAATATSSASQSLGTPGKGSADPGSNPKKVGSLSSLVGGLEERLKENPGDGSGWLLLAKTYHHLGRDDDARIAYEKAVNLDSTDAAFEELLSQKSVDSPSNSAIQGDGTAIKGRVRIDEKIVAGLNPEAAVFVFARNASGSPMPLAVVRKSVSEIPFDFVLDDSLAMSAGMTLSSASEVIVTAKVSSTGNAMQTDAGLEVSTAPFAVQGSDFIDLIISEKK